MAPPAPAWVSAHKREVLDRFARGDRVVDIIGWLASLGFDATPGGLAGWFTRQGVSRPRPPRRASVPTPGHWSHQHGQTVRDMADQGCSGREIAARISADSRQTVSRNAIISWAHRAGVRLASGRARRAAEATPRLPVVAVARVPVRERGNAVARPAPANPAKPQATHALPRARRATPPVTGSDTILSRRRDGCAWIDSPYEEPATALDRCCNAPVEPGTSWCAGHLAIVRAPS